MDTTHRTGDRKAARSLGWALITLVVLVPAAARASSLQASPVSITFEPTAQAQALQLDNTGSEPLEAQVRVQRWSQRDGQDVLEEANDIVATPAIVKVAPGQRQVVRLVRSQAAAPAREQAYRVLVDELPGNRAAGTDSGLQVLLRYSIPVFVNASATPASVDLSTLRAQLAANAEGQTELRVLNRGPAHVRISALATEAGTAARELVPGLVGYVLPGQQMAFPVDLPLPLAAGQTLKARFNDDREARPVPLDRVGP